jgi:O-antigen chain-terminating methyltransferase
MSDIFYRAFEDRHRGSREEVKARLKVYLPFVLPVSHMHAEGLVLDLGCGRGEWLQLLQEHGVLGQGIDLDEGMLEACHAQGLKAQKGDALSFLQALPSDSVIAVTAFHLVEHIGFDAIRMLVLDAHRVLKPGGLLIMETPNPENIVVATKNFHMDPSHLKPLPPELLAFLPEHAGYARVKTIRLQESPSIHLQNNLSLQDVLGGASPDYAVIAQKRILHNDPEFLKQSFSEEFGISSAQLAERYDQQQVTRQQSLKQTEELVSQLQTETRDLACKVDFWGSQLAAVYSSRSWKMTAPLRWVNFQLMRLKQDGLDSRLKALYRKIFPAQPPVASNQELQRQLVNTGIPDSQVAQLTPHTKRQLLQLHEAGKRRSKD